MIKIQYGGQYGVHISVFANIQHIKIYKYLVICLNLGFHGQGIQKWRNKFCGISRYGGNSKWRPIWRMTPRFLRNKVSCYMSKPKFLKSRNKIYDKANFVRRTNMAEIQDGGHIERYKWKRPPPWNFV